MVCYSKCAINDRRFVASNLLKMLSPHGSTKPRRTDRWAYRQGWAEGAHFRVSMSKQHVGLAMLRRVGGYERTIHVGQCP